jgi:aquaglyceroporin related protein
MIRAPLAEFLGVAVFVFIGSASDCQAVLSSNPNVSPTSKGTFLSLDFGWATGLSLGIWISAGISGGHINPAITLALAFWRKFSWKKVPIYIMAQVAGGLVGAAATYGQYLQAINIYEEGGANRTIATGGLFAPFPIEYLSSLALFTSELVGTGILALMIMAATDKHNAAPDLSLLPVAIFIIVLALGVALGMHTYSFNPARDLGSRLFLAMVGYGGVTFSYRRHYWIWGGFIAPTLGAVIAVGVYDLLLRRKEPTPAVMRENFEADAKV